MKNIVKNYKNTVNLSEIYNKQCLIEHCSDKRSRKLKSIEKVTLNLFYGNQITHIRQQDYLFREDIEDQGSRV